ncbi:hypothetical protein DVA67_030375 [Solirubrobacter sp. CPCC 204708]|uniref:PLL-like beta propeller domain-containing protein n=1 Tax=Solirubrobacter deserti TaxID=2282478 RepID=A0ABT4RIG0_9ACTN|nr:hypothetical protein [Solirubrobacter deserti]MBE2320312.1 hypothetical protein [Solirubrobacter deserti]MDA0138302.1 hypothetical protein [Solirubrobacter deserti]
MRRAVVFALAALALSCAAPAYATRTVALDAAGAVHAYVVGSDGALYHAPPGGVLTRLGGEQLAQQPVAVERDATGTLLVAARAEDGTVYALPDGEWSARVPIGTGAAGPPDLLLDDGRLAAFYRGVDGKLWTATQAATGWSAPEALAEDVAGEPAAILDRNGDRVVTVRAGDGTLTTAWHTGAAWARDSLGGPVTGDPALVRHPDGRLEVFARGTDGALWRSAQEPPAFAFSAWAPLAPDAIAGSPAAALDGAGHLHVFARDAAGALRLFSGGTVESLGGALTGDPAAIRAGSSLIHVVAPGEGARWFVRSQAGLLTWEPLFRALGEAAPPKAPDPVIVVPAPPRAPEVVSPVYAPKRLLVDLRANAKNGVFKALTLRGVPAGATVTATCAKGCKRPSLTFTNVSGTVSLKAFFAKRAKQGTLKAGTKIRVVVSAPNMIGAVKTLTVRARKAPSVATRCLAPGATTESLC